MGDVIQDLAVVVATSDIADAGTDNDVYFDIGPLGWKLSSDGDDFERGSVHTYQLDTHGLRLDTDDIIWLHLQKKGLFGITGTAEGPFNSWHPQRVDLLVNGNVFATVDIGRWIDNDNPTWMHVLRSGSAPELFARTLRMLSNDALKLDQETVAFFTTPFKLLGLSGWLGLSLPVTCARGMVIRTPAQSTDGLATIDIRLSTVQVGDQVYILDGASGIRLPRFLRVEYQFAQWSPQGGLLSDVQTIPNEGDFVRICGDLKIDTDQEGWYEIHPRGPHDVAIGPPPHCLRKFMSASGFDPTQGLRSHVALPRAFSVRSLMGV